MSLNQPIICIDLDGTLAEYTTWLGHEHIGEPIEEGKIIAQILHDNGWKIIINTCRNNGMNGESKTELKQITTNIGIWLDKHDIPYDVIATREMGKPFADVYLDDRALCFNPENIGVIVRELGAKHARLIQSREAVA